MAIFFAASAGSDAFAVDDGPVYTLQEDPDQAGLLYALLEDPEVPKVTASSHDLRFLGLMGVPFAGPLHDVKVMAYRLNENTPLDLDWLSKRYASISMDKQLKRSGGHVYLHTHDGSVVDLDDLSRDSLYWDEFVAYNHRDVNALRELYGSLYERLEESEWLDHYLTEDVPYTNVLLRMELRGMPVNLTDVEKLREAYEPLKEQLGRELLAEAGLPEAFNLNSTQQMASYLFSRVLTLTDSLRLGKDTADAVKSCLDGQHDDCGWDEATALAWEDNEDGSVVWLHVVDLLPEGFTVDRVGRDIIHGHYTLKGRGLRPTPPPTNPLTGEVGKFPSTSSPELLYMHAGDPWVRKLCLEYRKLEKLLTTYLTKWPVQAYEGRIYARFNQTGTVTGRLSSSGPNLQNVPSRGDRGKAMRGLFQGQLIVADYDQLEMRLMAHFSEDPRLMDVFRRGEDPHLLTARAIFGAGVDPDSDERGIGKTLNFAIGYGAGAKKVAQVLSLSGYATTKEQAKDYLDEISHFYRRYYRWKTEVIQRAKRKGHVATIGGARRRLTATFKDTANWKLTGYGERQAVNAIIQGSAADIIRRVMVRLEVEVPSCPIIAQVHDELVFEGFGYGAELEYIQRIGETGHGFDLRVPLLFAPHAGPDWAAAKEGPDLAALFEEDE